jgi:hypothetical protein
VGRTDPLGENPVVGEMAGVSALGGRRDRAVSPRRGETIGHRGAATTARILSGGRTVKAEAQQSVGIAQMATVVAGGVIANGTVAPWVLGGPRIGTHRIPGGAIATGTTGLVQTRIDGHRNHGVTMATGTTASVAAVTAAAPSLEASFLVDPRHTGQTDLARGRRSEDRAIVSPSARVAIGLRRKVVARTIPEMTGQVSVMSGNRGSYPRDLSRAKASRRCRRCWMTSRCLGR